MKDETRLWLAYADENLQMARIALERGFFNASLQNAQQAVEKVLKALLIQRGRECPRTHSIRDLVRAAATGSENHLTAEECDLLDSIYIPSKYPVFGVLPGEFASREVCERCLLIAERTTKRITSELG
jgi:HEPN domain-containing protein